MQITTCGNRFSDPHPGQAGAVRKRTTESSILRDELLRLVRMRACDVAGTRCRHWSLALSDGPCPVPLRDHLVGRSGSDAKSAFVFEFPSHLDRVWFRWRLPHSGSACPSPLTQVPAECGGGTAAAAIRVVERRLPDVVGAAAAVGPAPAADGDGDWLLEWAFDWMRAGAAATVTYNRQQGWSDDGDAALPDRSGLPLRLTRAPRIHPFHLFSSLDPPPPPVLSTLFHNFTPRRSTVRPRVDLLARAAPQLARARHLRRRPQRPHPLPCVALARTHARAHTHGRVATRAASLTRPSYIAAATSSRRPPPPRTPPYLSRHTTCSEGPSLGARTVLGGMVTRARARPGPGPARRARYPGRAERCPDRHAARRYFYFDCRSTGAARRRVCAGSGSDMRGRGGGAVTNPRKVVSESELRRTVPSPPVIKVPPPRPRPPSLRSPPPRDPARVSSAADLRSAAAGEGQRGAAARPAPRRRRRRRRAMARPGLVPPPSQRAGAPRRRRTRPLSRQRARGEVPGPCPDAGGRTLVSSPGSRCVVGAGPVRIVPFPRMRDKCCLSELSLLIGTIEYSRYAVAGP